jgi:hypothetical protein
MRKRRSMKKCPKCPNLFADKANYCKVHRGKNPLLEKSFEKSLLEYYRRLLAKAGK